MNKRTRSDWDEEPLEDDYSEDDESDTVDCPHCGKPVYEDAEQCPYCGDYIVPGESTSVLSGKPIWYVTLVLFGIFAVILASMFAVY
ncbi:MAG: zinc ribbon domain-containing protein [Planctomycetota bacterium]